MENQIDRAKLDLARVEDLIRHHSDIIRKHDAELEKAQKAREDILTFIRLFEAYSSTDLSAIVEMTGKAISGYTNSERIARIAEEQIQRTGHRVATETVYRAALAAGIQIGGKDDAARQNNVSGILSRNERFHGLRRRGWWLKALGPCPDDSPQQTLTSVMIVSGQIAETADHPVTNGSAVPAESRPTSEGTEPVRPVDPRPGGGT